MIKYVLLAFIAACANLPYIETDPELLSYLEEYQNDVIDRGLHYRAIPALFVGSSEACQKESAAACCISYNGVPNHIRVVESVWDNLTELTRKALMYHEQGHCAQGLGHTDSGIMRSYLIPPDTEENWETLKDEFFSLDSPY